MNKKGMELTTGNVITVGIIVVLVFVVMMIFGPKLLGLGKSGSELFGLDICPQTGLHTGEYEVMIQDFLVQGKYDDALDKYEEFAACFPKTKIGLSQSQKDLLEFQAAKKKYMTEGESPEVYAALDRIAQSENPFVSAEALYLEGKVYEAAKDKAGAQKVYKNLVLKYSKSTLPEVQLRVGYAQWYLANIDEAIAAYSVALKSSDNSVKLTAADGLIGIAEEHAKFCETYEMQPQEAEIWKEDGLKAVSAVTKEFGQGTAKYIETEKMIERLNKACK